MAFGIILYLTMSFSALHLLQPDRAASLLHDVLEDRDNYLLPALLLGHQISRILFAGSWSAGVMDAGVSPWLETLSKHSVAIFWLMDRRLDRVKWVIDAI